MKYKILLAIVSIGFLGVFWTACDKADPSLILIDQQSTTDDYLDTLYVIDSVSVSSKHVLLEDFTGHKCVNCPEAALEAHNLAEELNHQLIIYSVHAGYYSDPDDEGNYTADFRCDAGNELNIDFQIIANPIGTVNRVEYGGSVLVGAGSWEPSVLSELEKENLVDLKVTNTFYPNLNTMQINVATSFLNAMEGNYKVVVYIAEDHIVAPQKNNNENIGPSPDWLDYEHRNILRDAVNSTYGESITTTGSVEAITYYSKYTYDMNPEWVTENCNLIIYVIQEDSGEILQVAELGIKTE